MTHAPAQPEPTETTLALRVVTMPKDTNHYGTIFGGVILSYIDQAGFVHAQTYARCRWVTAAVGRVDFVAPVYTGDTLDFLTYTEREGTTSVTVGVIVEVERAADGKRERVTTASVTLVAVTDDGTPRPFRSTPGTPVDAG